MYNIILLLIRKIFLDSKISIICVFIIDVVINIIFYVFVFLFVKFIKYNRYCILLKKKFVIEELV